jgi:hypothetical protein
MEGGDIWQERLERITDSALGSSKAVIVSKSSTFALLLKLHLGSLENIQEHANASQSVSVRRIVSKEWPWVVKAVKNERL